jgi:hypothetical protein
VKFWDVEGLNRQLLIVMEDNLAYGFVRKVLKSNATYFSVLLCKSYTVNYTFLC